MRFVDGWWIQDHAWPTHPVHSQRADREVIDVALAYIPGREVVVQAGARVGLWPRMLARSFNTVYAFEADPDNYACAAANLANQPRVTLYAQALGAASGSAIMERSTESDGLHFVASVRSHTSIDIPMTSIDGLHLKACDAIFLDVEGYELDALQGAFQTIDLYHPVLVLEENILCQRYGRERGALAAYLEPRGYRLVEEFGTLPAKQQRIGFPGADLIFVYQ